MFNKIKDALNEEKKDLQDKQERMEDGVLKPIIPPVIDSPKEPEVPRETLSMPEDYEKRSDVKESPLVIAARKGREGRDQQGRPERQTESFVKARFFETPSCQ